MAHDSPRRRYLQALHELWWQLSRAATEAIVLLLRSNLCLGLFWWWHRVEDIVPETRPGSFGLLWRCIEESVNEPSHSAGLTGWWLLRRIRWPLEEVVQQAADAARLPHLLRWWRLLRWPLEEVSKKELQAKSALNRRLIPGRTHGFGVVGQSATLSTTTDSRLVNGIQLATNPCADAAVLTKLARPAPIFRAGASAGTADLHAYL